MWRKVRTKEIAFILLGLIGLTIADDTLYTEENCPSSTSYLCKGGTKCIVKAYICNQQTDCPERDDETDCGKKRFIFPRSI